MCPQNSPRAGGGGRFSAPGPWTGLFEEEKRQTKIRLRSQAMVLINPGD